MQTLSPQTFTECKQRNPYAGDTITCKGYVHSLKIVLSDGFTRYDDGIVCDAHMPGYLQLAENPNRGFTIETNEIVGTIGPPS